MRKKEIPRLIFFDLDGTLTESKEPLSETMASLLVDLLERTNVGIISGGAFSQFLKQVVSRLPAQTELGNLYLLPTSGGALYWYRHDDWQKVYEERLEQSEVMKIEESIESVVRKSGLIDMSAPSYGSRIESRGSQVTFSALGQNAPIADKKKWDPDKSKRRQLQQALSPRLPEFSVGMGGSTSLDITKKNIDKAYGIHRLSKQLQIPESDVLYVGDELEAGGNDEAVYKTSAHVYSVKNPSDTERFITRELA